MSEWSNIYGYRSRFVSCATREEAEAAVKSINAEAARRRAEAAKAEKAASKDKSS